MVLRPFTGSFTGNQRTWNSCRYTVWYPSYKNAVGSSAWDAEEPVQQACRLIKNTYPELVVVTDACLCEYTEHGHCGVLENGCTVNNDETLPLLAKIAVSHAQAGADVIAPSNMMDGYVKVMR